VTTLVAGWFSFEGMGATAGDLLASEVVQSWLSEAGEDFDVAFAPPFSTGVRWEDVEPSRYDRVVFVCGPIGNGPPVREFLDRFAGADLIGIDLTMLDRLESWNPFGLLLERDSNRTSRPDLTFAARPRRVPVVGVVLMHEQPEYGERDHHRRANEALLSVLEQRPCARVAIDTRLDEGTNPLRTPEEVVSLVAAVDVVVTTRLHGLVLALASGVPALAVDPVAGGAKITRQAARLGWPNCFPADTSIETLRDALDACLEADAARAAREVAQRARNELDEVRRALLDRYPNRSRVS
jgi:hypothetical protein